MLTYKDVWSLFLSNNIIVCSIITFVCFTFLLGIINTTSIWYKIVLLLYVMNSYIFGYFVGRFAEKYKRC